MIESSASGQHRGKRDALRDSQAVFDISLSRNVQRLRKTYGKPKFGYKIFPSVSRDALKKAQESWSIAKQTIETWVSFSFQTGSPLLESHPTGQRSAGLGEIEGLGLVVRTNRVFSMWGHEKHRAGSVGLTDQTSRDLYGIVAPRPLAVLKMPVRIKRVCLGCRGEAPAVFHP
jgi:hypothetical protein